MSDQAPVVSPVEQVARNWWTFLAAGVVSIACGVLMVVYPDLSLLAFGLFVGVGLMFAGVLEIVDAIVGPPEGRALAAIVGVLSVLGGVVCLRRPGESLLALVVLLGAYLIVAGIVRFVRAVAELGDRAARMALALLDVILGTLILALPRLSLVTLAVLFAVSLLARGAWMLLVAFRLRGSRGRPEPRAAAPA
jgi:uncharacterized membrane protein HdeD (DUF308 family)